jgi:hypothetical protein
MTPKKNNIQKNDTKQNDTQRNNTKCSNKNATPGLCDEYGWSTLALLFLPWVVI